MYNSHNGLYFSNAANTSSPLIAPGPTTTQTGAQDGEVLQPRVAEEKTQI